METKTHTHTDTYRKLEGGEPMPLLAPSWEGFILYRLLVSMQLISVVFSQEKIQKHWEHLELLFSIVMSIIFERGSLETEKNVNMLSSRIHNPLCKLSGFPKGIVEKNQINNVDLSPTKSIRIPHTDKLPQYTSWVYVARCVWLSSFIFFLSK